MKTILPSWLGSFYGSDMPWEQYQSLATTKFKLDGDTIEEKCRDACWFDYFRLHPLQRAYFFAKCYSYAYRRYFIKYFDSSQTRHGVSNEDFTQSREARSFWNVRRYCDLEGFEYQWFIDSFMKYRLESGEFKNHMPRPCHLMPKSDVELDAIRTCWKAKTNGDVLITSSDPYFLVSNWEGTKKQISHEHFLLEQVRNKRIKRFSLEDLVYKRQLLRIEAVMMAFPEEVREIQRNK